MSTAAHHAGDDHGAARRLRGAMYAAAAAEFIGRAALAVDAYERGELVLDRMHRPAADAPLHPYPLGGDPA